MKLFNLILAIFLWSDSSFGQLPKGWKVEAVDSIKVTRIMQKGKWSIRFELNKEDRIVNGGKRAEIATQGELMNVERWYSLSIYLPRDYLADSIPEIVAQWHAQPDKDKGETWRSPPIALFIKNGHWFLDVRWSEKPVNTNRNVDGHYAADLGSIQTEKWIGWKFHIKFSYKADGYIQVWKDGIQILNKNGYNYYNDEKGPFFKFGIYKWMWNNPKATNDNITKRVLYFSNVRILNKASEK